MRGKAWEGAFQFTEATSHLQERVGGGRAAHDLATAAGPVWAAYTPTVPGSQRVGRTP